MPRGRLGRGLAALMGDQHAPTPPGMRRRQRVAGPPARPIDGEQRIVGIDQVRASPLNPRRDFREDELDELANSIRQKGMHSAADRAAALVDGVLGYEIVAGERRWRAAQRAGLHTLPVIVRELDDQAQLELALIENVQRADLNRARRGARLSRPDRALPDIPRRSSARPSARAAATSPTCCGS